MNIETYDSESNKQSNTKFVELMSFIDSEIERIKEKVNTKEFVYLGAGGLRMTFDEAISYLGSRKS